MANEHRVFRINAKAMTKAEYLVLSGQNTAGGTFSVRSEELDEKRAAKEAAKAAKEAEKLAKQAEENARKAAEEATKAAEENKNGEDNNNERS